MLWPIHRLTANCGKVMAHSFSQDERGVCHYRAHGSPPPTLAFAQMRRTRRMTAPLPPTVTSGVSPSGIVSKRSRSSVINFGVIGTKLCSASESHGTVVSGLAGTETESHQPGIRLIGFWSLPERVRSGAEPGETRE
jgi:hypothetical protein